MQNVVTAVVAAASANASPTPPEAITTPPSAGPIIAPRSPVSAISAPAAAILLRGSRVGVTDISTVAEIPPQIPSTIAARYTTQSLGSGRNALIASTAKATPAQPRARAMTRRRSYRSARMPPANVAPNVVSPSTVDTAATWAVDAVISYTCSGTATMRKPSPNSDTTRAVKM